jgi:LysM repeat protein
MAEGGYFPWKVQKLRIDPHLEVKDFCKCLPLPPSGFYWERKDDHTWDLKKFEKSEVPDAFPNAVSFRSETLLVHTILPRDTLAGLSLRYRVSQQELRRFNLLSTNNIQALKELKIPIKHNQPVVLQSPEEEDVVVRRFINQTGCEKEEALFYLSEHDSDLSDALTAWSHDEAFVRTFPQSSKNNFAGEIETADEETRIESVQRSLPFKIVQPTRIVFVDSDYVAPSQVVFVQPSAPLAVELAPMSSV